MTNKYLKWLFLTQILLAVNINAAPITFNTALPVAKDAFVNREQFVFKRFKDDKSPLQRNLDANGLVSVLAYGINSKLAVFAAMPYLQKDITFKIESGHFNLVQSGHYHVALTPFILHLTRLFIQLIKSLEHPALNFK